MTMLGYGAKIADGTKVAHELTLNWRDYSGVPGRYNVITRVLVKGRGRQKRKSVSQRDLKML